MPIEIPSGRLSAHVIRHIAVLSESDPRTVRRLLYAEGRVMPMQEARIRRVCAEHEVVQELVIERRPSKDPVGDAKRFVAAIKAHRGER